MPIVQIKVPKGMASEETLEQVRVATRANVLEALSASQAHHDYVTVSEEIGKIGDAFPLVLVDLRPGREQWRKEKFAKLTSKVLGDALDIEERHVFVIYRESAGNNFYVGDGFLEPFDPAEHRTA